MNDLGQLRADLADFLDSPPHFLGETVHAHHARRDSRAHFLDHLFDIIGGHGRLVGQAADLHGDHRETEAVFAGLFGLDCGVEGKQVGLVGDLGDGGDNGIDVAGLLVEHREFRADRTGGFHDLAHGGFHAGDGVLSAAGKMSGVLGNIIDLVHRLDQFARSGGDLLGRGADFRRGGGNLGGGALLFLGRGGDLGGGGIDLDAGALHLADQD